MLKVEAAYGEDIRIVLKKLYEQHGTQVGVAKSIGVEQSIVNIWAARLGVVFDKQPIARIAGLDGFCG
jgi:hypothetical protein